MDAVSFRAGFMGIGLELSDTQLAALARFEQALYEANESVNLTRVARPDCQTLHFLDSLLFHDLIPRGARVLDIGTGPGLPAWPLACARADLHLVGVDSSGKMLDFLRAQALSNLECIQARAESCGLRERFDVVTGRALAPLAMQLELSAAPCRIGGLVIPMRTSGDLDTIETLNPARLGLELREIVRRVLPQVNAERVFPVYAKVASTPNRYPRAWAAIKRDPIGT